MKDLVVGEFEIVCRGNGHGAGYVEHRSGPKDYSGWVHEKEISSRITQRVDRAEDARGVPAGDPTQDVNGVEGRGRVQKLCGLRLSQGESIETMKKIRAIAWSCSTRNLYGVTSGGDGCSEITGSLCRNNSCCDLSRSYVDIMECHQTCQYEGRGKCPY